MGGQKKSRRMRADCKINQLPQDVKDKVDALLVDPINSRQSVQGWLVAQGYDISYTAVCRYANRMDEAAQRIADDLARTKAIVDYLNKNPDVDPAKAARVIMKSGLLQRISTADEEFYGMSLEKAGNLLSSLSRIDLAEKKLSFEMRKKIDLAFDEMEGQLLAAINHDPTLSEQFHKVLLAAKEKMTDNEQENS